jgi:hypothetical protein
MSALRHSAARAFTAKWPPFGVMATYQAGSQTAREISARPWLAVCPPDWNNVSCSGVFKNVIPERKQRQADLLLK